MDNEDGDACWAMSSDKYCSAIIQNVEHTLKEKVFRLPSKCYTPLQNGYKPELNCIVELKSDGLQWYQEMVGQLRWAIKIGHCDLLLEVSHMYWYLASTREGHLGQVLHIMGYVKCNPKFRLLFDSGYPRVNEKWFIKYDWFDFYRDAKEDIPPNMPEARGLDVILTCFVDANHAGNVSDRRIQTGILIFINNSPI